MAGVVVGVARTGGSGAAVRWASAAADLHGLPLALVHAWDEPVDLAVDLDPSSLPDLVRPAMSCAEQGRPRTVLLLGHRPDLLVLGGHPGARRLTRLRRTCLHHATCPMVVVPDVEQSLHGRIVVGVCGTDASAAALRWAAAEARLRRAALVVCYAWQVHPVSVHDLISPARAVPSQQDTARERVGRWVRQALGPHEFELDVVHGAPLEVLFRAGAAADLLVLGRSHRSFFGRVLHGAVVDDLSALTPCPVAVIPRGYAAPQPSCDEGSRHR